MTHILVVEDDDAIALVVETVLTHEGYTLDRAADAAQALDLARTGATRGGYALLLADVTLPGGTDGLELARTLRSGHPSLPVVLMSGTFEEKTPTPEGLDGAVLLPKPFRRAGLLTALRSVLSETVKPG